MDRHSNYDKYHYDDYAIIGHISSPEEHFVEDARTHGELSSNKENTKGKPTKRKKRISTLITILLTILCFSVTLFLADIIASGTGLSAYVAIFAKKQKDNLVFYAVCASHSSDMSVSYKNAAAIREEGGGGYVLKKDTEYYVVLNVYESKSDAESVANKRSNYSILEIVVPPYDEKKYPSLSAAAETKDLYLESYRTFYDTANNVTEKKYSTEDMKRSLAQYKDKVVASVNAYTEKIKGKEDNATIDYKVVLAGIESAFENILSSSDRPVADARYYSIMILHQYSLFSKKYA